MIRIEVLKLHTPSKKIQLKIVLDRTVNLMKSELFQALHKSPNFKPGCSARNELNKQIQKNTKF